MKKLLFLVIILSGCSYLKPKVSSYSDIQVYNIALSKFKVDRIIEKIVADDKDLIFEYPEQYRYTDVFNKWFVISANVKTVGRVGYIFYFEENYDDWLQEDSVVMNLSGIYFNCNTYWYDEYIKLDNTLKDSVQNFINDRLINKLNAMEPFYSGLEVAVINTFYDGIPEQIYFINNINGKKIIYDSLTYNRPQFTSIIDSIDSVSGIIYRSEQFSDQLNYELIDSCK